MKIAYIKTKWEDKKTPVNAINLGNIENTLEKVTEGALGIDQLKADPGIVINEDTDNNEIRVGIDPGFIVTPGNLTTEINKINADIIEETERAKEAELKNHNSITFLQTQLNNIVNGDASSAIESFNEILEFLSSISDSTTLAGIVSQLNNSIQAEVTRATAAETINSQLISSLQTSVNGIISGNISIHTAISNLQAVIQNVAENGFNVIDPSGNIGLKYDENGFDVALLSSHVQGLIKSVDGIGLALGETNTTAYSGDKGKANADNISGLQTSLGTLTQNNNVDHKTYNDGILSLQGSLRSLSTIVSTLQSLITQVTENGFHVIDANGNVGMKYDDNGLDAALLSTHFQSLINALVSTGITSEKGSTLAPLVNSIIPATYLPSYVDDVVDIDLFGTTLISQYCSDNDGNTSVLADKFCYDDENKIFVIARQINNTIDLVDSGSPEQGKIYIDISTNKTYRWSGTNMAAISNDMTLGETSGTAYAGDKGKLNADNISYLRSLITALTTLVVQINEVGFNVIDANGNIGMKYGSDGLDVALLSSHFKNLIKSIEGIGGTVSSSIILDAISLILRQTSENGYYVTDVSGNIGAKYDANGFDVALLSTHFKSLIKSIEGIGGTASSSSILSAISSILCQTSEKGYYVVDVDGNVGMKYDANGFDVALLSTHLRSLISNYFTSNSSFNLLSLNTSDGLLSIYHQKEVKLCLPSTAKIILYGDSISSTDYTFYKERMQYYTGISDVNNNGLSGRTTAYLASNAALTNILNYTPDLIIIQVGGNDVGDIVGTFGAVPSETNVTETDISVDYNGTYWIQAVSHIIRKVKAYYYDIVTRAALTGSETASEKIAKIAAVKKPHIAVLTPTPQKRSGGSTTWSYQPNWIRKRNAVVECCNKYNVQCIDVYCDWGVDMSLEPEWSSPTDQINQHGIYTMDGLHPSQSGYERIVQLITGKINITIK